MRIPLVQLDPTLPVPTHARPGDAGVDLCAAHGGSASPGNRVLVSMGIAIELPPGKVGLICPRSGLAAKGISVTNAPGIIDSGFRGEIKVWVENLQSPPGTRFDWPKGERLCQLVIVDYTEIEFEVVKELGSTERGTDGFGSTGTDPIQYPAATTSVAKKYKK